MSLTPVQSIIAAALIFIGGAAAFWLIWQLLSYQ